MNLDNTQNELKLTTALDIINTKIVELTKLYSTTTNKGKSLTLDEKLNVLQNIKKQIYLGNENIIDKVIEKKRKDIL